MIPPVADQFVAGETPAEALEHARRLRERGVRSIVNLLGEHYDRRAPADADTAVYRRLIEDIGKTNLGTCISVKPSQVGLRVGEEVLAENVRDIVRTARRHDVFVWIDMENPGTVDPTIRTFEAVVSEYPRVGLCVQANLKRAGDDLAELVDYPGKLRLVKGAYTPPEGEGYRDRDRVDEAYREHLEYLFREYDGTVAVGTHDRALIEAAIGHHETYGTDFEIQMLMGVREDLQFELAEDYDVYQYAPFGRKWLAYFSRRVAERRENLAFALRAIASG